jgi:hypothetical protein
MALKALAALALLALVVAGCGGGGGPHFQSAAGWQLLSTSNELSAANVPFAAADRSMESPPSQTVATLPRDGIVVWAMYQYGTSDFPRRPLPLRVEQAARATPFEGFLCAPAVTTARCFAASGSIRHLEARHGSYAVDLYVFFGTDRPPPAEVAAANAELARLNL